MKPWLVELWKSRVQYLRPYYACTKPQQTDYPINSRHVWSLPLMWTCWSTLILAIMLLALTVEDIMDTGSALANLNLALYLNTPLMVFWWRFAVLMSEEDSHSRYYKSKLRFCPCSMCSHSLLRNGCVMTRTFKSGVPVTMVIQPLKHKCCRRRRVKFIVHHHDTRRVISLLLMLAGDVETNPGPLEYEDYVSSLPTKAREYLKNEIDWDHGGVEEDLDYIAQYLTDWEEKLVVPLRFKQNRLAILKEKHKNDPMLLRLDFLREWKNSKGYDATYETLLKACCVKDAASAAKAVCYVLRKRVDAELMKSGEHPNMQDVDSAMEVSNTQACSSGKKRLLSIVSEGIPPKRHKMLPAPPTDLVITSESPGHYSATTSLSHVVIPPEPVVATKLTIADKADVYRATKPAAALWEDIGLALKIHPTELEKIKHDISGADDRLKQVLSLWLTGNGGECSWRFLCAAMRDDLVARPDLAKNIEKQYLQ